VSERQRATLAYWWGRNWQAKAAERGSVAATCGQCNRDYDKPVGIRARFCLDCTITNIVIQRRASAMVARAIRHGELPKVSGHACYRCGSEASVYEHRDYTKPLDVRPVCRSCNGLLGRADVWCEEVA